MDGPFRVVLRSPVVSSVWYGRGVYRSPGRQDCSVAGKRVDGAGCMPGHSRDHCTSLSPCWRCRERSHGAGAGCGGRGWALRGGARASCGARVIGTVRSTSDQSTALKNGAHDVVLSDKDLIARVRALAPEGIDHIVEVAFGANIEADVELLKFGGSIASYATDNAAPHIPFWQMVFKNIRVFFLGSDDFPNLASVVKEIGRAPSLAKSTRSLRTPKKETEKPGFCARWEQRCCGKERLSNHAAERTDNHCGEPSKQQDPFINFRQGIRPDSSSPGISQHASPS